MNVWMLISKAGFTVAVGAFYLVWGLGTLEVWRSTSPLVFALAVVLYLPPATWVFYVTGMGINRAEHESKLPELSAYIAKLMYPMAGGHNFLNNAISMSLLFLDIPREPATTKRLNRYADGPDGRRKSIALFIREQLLNWADRRGIHT